MTAPVVRIVVGHKSSRPHVYWCAPVGWSPANQIPECTWCHGHWEAEDFSVTAALGVVLAEGFEGDEIDVPLSDVFVMQDGTCRFLADAQLTPAPKRKARGGLTRQQIRCANDALSLLEAGAESMAGHPGDTARASKLWRGIRILKSLVQQASEKTNGKAKS